MSNYWVFTQSRRSKSSIWVVTFWESIFFKLWNNDNKCKKKITVLKLIRCLGTYFSIEIFSINQCFIINYFFFIIILNFLFFTNLSADLNNDDEKYSKLIRWSGTYFSKEKFVNKSKLELIISFFIIILNFLFPKNLSGDFCKFFKCRLFNKNSTENVCEQWEITETNNWIRLLIFDDKS